jgi:hypothetical protein
MSTNRSQIWHQLRLALLDGISPSERLPKMLYCSYCDSRTLAIAGVSIEDEEHGPIARLHIDCDGGHQFDVVVETRDGATSVWTEPTDNARIPFPTWLKLVGNEFAAHVVPHEAFGGVLIVTVSTFEWGAALDEAAAGIIALLKQELDLEITVIKYRLRKNAELHPVFIKPPTSLDPDQPAPTAAEWEAIVPAELALCTRPAHIADTALIVDAYSPAFARLVIFQESDIVLKLRARGYPVTRVRARVAPWPSK